MRGNEFIRLSHLAFDFLAMVVEICQRGINVGQGKLRKLRDDFLRRKPLQLVPDHDVLDTDARSRNTRLSATDPRVHIVCARQPSAETCLPPSQGLRNTPPLAAAPPLNLSVKFGRIH